MNQVRGRTDAQLTTAAVEDLILSVRSVCVTGVLGPSTLPVPLTGLAGSGLVGATGACPRRVAVRGRGGPRRTPHPTDPHSTPEESP